MLAVFILAVSGEACADDACTYGWHPTQEFPGIYGASVSSLFSWDFDGPGPASDILVVGGFFEAAGSTVASNIASWDGQSWSAFGEYPDARVYAMTDYNGELIIAGNFSSVGDVPANHIARWNGEHWQALANGLSGPVYTLAVYNGELIVGGSFNSADGISAKNIARWNGANWSSLADGVNSGTVRSLAEYNGELIVAGSFTLVNNISAFNVARWNGTDWQPFAGGTNGTVTDVLVQGDDLFVGGSFSSVGGVVQAVRIARFDGTSWHALASGMNAQVKTLSIYGGRLIAGGDFTIAGGVGIKYLAAWDGAEWCALGSGLDGESVETTTVYRDTLIVAGRFRSAGGIAAYSVSSWNGKSWRCLASGECEHVFDPINALTVWKSQIIAGGVFAGQPEGTGLASRNGSIWESVGGGTKCGPGLGSCSYPESPTVTAFGEFNDELIVGGEFTYAGDVEVNHIARWNGTQWGSLGEGLSGCQAFWECTSTVYSLMAFDGELVVGGNFDSAGNVLTGPIARWDGLNWKPLVAISHHESHVSTVNALATFRGDLIVGGFFTLVDDMPASHIVRWDGVTWHSLGSGVDDPYDEVKALIVLGDKLIAAGGFRSIGGIPVNIAAWDGSVWAPLGSGLPFPVNALAMYDGALIAGGTCLSQYGGADCIARFDGETWNSLGAGVSGAHYPTPIVNALTNYEGNLYVGGGFHSAGGEPSAGLALWGPTGIKGDADGDGEVTRADFEAWPACLSGPTEASGTGNAPSQCLCWFNTDGDGDVDLGDFALYQRSVGAP